MTNDQEGIEEPIDVAGYGRALADAVAVAIPGWTHAMLVSRAAPSAPSQEFELVKKLTNSVIGPLTQLLTADIDAQRQSPLALLRALIEPMTEELHALGAVAPSRDPFDEDAFPNDIYALGPTAWSDFGEEVGDAGLRWGAAKAMAHRQRHGRVERHPPGT
jgi:hypothetical protein